MEEINEHNIVPLVTYGASPYVVRGEKRWKVNRDKEETLFATMYYKLYQQYAKNIGDFKR